MSNPTVCTKVRWPGRAPNPLIAAWAKRQVPQAKARYPELFPPSAAVRRAERIRAERAAQTAQSTEETP